MKKPDKKKILKALKILFGVLVVVFLAWYFWKNWDEFSDKIMNVDMGIFIFSMLFYFLYKITLASLWHYITKLNGCAIKYEKAVTSYLYSILGKYIPGKVFMLAARLTYYKEEDAPLSKVTVCFFIENVCTLLGAAMLFIVSRSLSGLSVVSFPKMKKEGTVADFSKKAETGRIRVTLICYLVLAITGMFILNPLYGAAAIVGAFLTFGWYYRMAMKNFGVINGDLAGWFLSNCELVMPLFMVAAHLIAAKLG